MDYEDIIIKPLVTEKSSQEVVDGKYTFKVAKNATKIQIRKAIENLFDVKVLKVNTMNLLGKTVNQRGRKGKKSDWKKAIVTIDKEPKQAKYLVNGGKEKKSTKKYKTEIEGFLGA